MAGYSRLMGADEEGTLERLKDAFHQVRSRSSIGERSLKNITRPLRVYRAQSEGPLPNPPPQAGEGGVGALRFQTSR